jgi:hypothetical protein
MERIYGYGMTTTSGGNLSILDDNGDFWITPAGVDKGSLTRSDIVFDSRIIPESYILLRNMPKLPYGATFLTLKDTAAIFTEDVPIAIAENDCVIATGNSLLTF